MLTGLKDLKSIDRAFEMGATDFVTKPVSWPLLAKRVRYMLRATRDRQELERREAMLEHAQRLASLACWESRADDATMAFSEPSGELLATATLCEESEFIARVHPEDRDAVVQARSLARASGRKYLVQYRLRVDDERERFIVEQAELRRDDSSQGAKLVGICQDVTDRKEMEQRVEFLAHRDALTGLPNRRLLETRLEQALARSRRDGKHVACLFLDLDRFKRVNDTLGHSAGDELLVETAKRLVSCVRDIDTVGRLDGRHVEPTVARFGGDEFIVLLEGIEREAEAARVAERIHRVFSQPLSAGGKDLHISPSIGITLFPRDGDNPETLLQNADAAMYVAKGSGSESFHFFDPSINNSAVHRLAIERELHQAIEENQFVLHYQPQYAVGDRSVTGVEALLRWDHPQRGLLSPAEFVTIAEEAGLIVTIGEWVLRQACCDWQALYETGTPPLRLSVNISATQIRRAEFVDDVRAVLRDTGYPADHLEIELTESVLIDHTELTEETLRQLKQSGIEIAIDDFGTGYSSLSYLKRFSIDHLKIDRSFVEHVTTDPRDASIVRAIIAMSQGLGMRVIAEGVEHLEQLTFLRECGCEEVQGFLLGRPQPLEQLIESIDAETASGLRLAS